VTETRIEYEHRVTPLELFFDLVFVFALTQVTTLLSNDPTWRGLGHGLLILTAVWWTWAGYAWLTNTVDPDEGAVRGAVLVAMGAIFIAALAVPHAFDNHGVLFGAAFLVVSVMHITLFALAGRGDPDLLAGVLRIAPAEVGGAALIIVAGFVDDPMRSILWLAAVVVGYVLPLFAGVRGFRVHPAHFVERHGLIVIIAVGESLVAIGLGARGTALGVGVICAAILGLVVAASLWLAYFDFFTIRAEQLLTERRGEQRTALARDVYTYLHLPMIVGIVLFAFAMKTTLAHVGNELDTISALGLCGGCSLYLFAFMGVRWRVSRSIGGGRTVAAVVLAALFPLALVVSAIAALAAVAAAWIALHVYELIWWREARAETRALRLPASAS
jgi:low temperature requirement protein LtrA